MIMKTFTAFGVEVSDKIKLERYFVKVDGVEYYADCGDGRSISIDSFNNWKRRGIIV